MIWRRKAGIRTGRRRKIFLDAGCEITGSIQLEAQGRAGDKVRIFYGEELDENGQVRYEMRCNCTYQEIWTLTDGISVFQPYEYKGFRYVLICPDETVRIRKISMTELLKCIDQFALTSTVCPGLLAVAPGSLMQEIADFSLLYPQLVRLYYRFTGDKKVVKTYLPVIHEMIAHFAQYEREDGLLEQVSDKWNLVDWPENLRDGYDFALTRPIVAPGCHNVINALYLGAMITANELEELIDGKNFYPVDFYRQAFLKAFYRENGLFADSETSRHMALHSNVYPLYFGFVPEGRENIIFQMIEQKGFSSGVMLSYYIFQALQKYGQQHPYRFCWKKWQEFIQIPKQKMDFIFLPIFRII